MKNITIEDAIYKWFDIKYELYSKLEHDGSIYWYYEGQEYADIRILKRFKSIYYKWELWNEFSEIFPIEYLIFEKFMSNWVGDTFNLKGFMPYSFYPSRISLFEIPK